MLPPIAWDLRSPSGCRFRERCWRATEKCATDVPELVTPAGADVSYACHFPL
jgi:ABC-type dipeptide/oligopeptide/nickel transport system ATPase component